MTYLYLLDINIISELIKNVTGVRFSKIHDVREDKINILGFCSLTTNYELI
ncbi:virulence-associated protein VapC-like protein (plasmid) ['Nostoc azollae' 0708]|uniref:Virulence-associated protein VapC-like protein n=1 Tax=Nostoc azollae (strain 0708) TaxID=551115 RepID=D7E5K4_NOSA0|nr:virulence-associated protein VapC-like protein ['Nostoc azollae' 0708]